MSKLEQHMEGIINVFHQYSIRTGDYDTLSKGELSQLLSKELANTIKNTRDKETVDNIFAGLDTNRDQQVDFVEFMTLVASVLKTAHENIHKE
ncbi:PREDICTED: protein S100-A12 [Propithecus coquereli]|uniref:Protein S100 n=1 Tax=Propithecus coquereli TaxID=379532 RepID=A0A2K6F9H1_PROCO|nr:PREDICTED: protein S100-A12 [Propithecus coquereli]